MNYKIREIEEKDNKEIERIIRECLIEFGGNREGLAWSDPELGRLSTVYDKVESKYWVAENENGKILGGTGIGKLKDLDGVCELQKMYCIKEVRGKGVSHSLINVALDFAKKHYKKCYLETLSNMIAANKFYVKNGFKRLEEPLIKTEHYVCDVWYIKEL